MFAKLQNYHEFLKPFEDSTDIHRIFLQTMVFQEAIHRPSCSHSSQIIDALSTDNYFESTKSFSRGVSFKRTQSLLFARGSKACESIKCFFFSYTLFESRDTKNNRKSFIGRNHKVNRSTRILRCCPLYLLSVNWTCLIMVEQEHVFSEVREIVSVSLLRQKSVTYKLPTTFAFGKRINIMFIS